MTIRVLLADDHALFRIGLKRLLSAIPDIVITAEAVNGYDALEKIRLDGWDVALMDINMPDMDGLEVLKRVITENEKHKILILSMYSEDEYALRAMRAGASGYLTKNCSMELLLTTIRRLATGKKYISQNLAEKFLFNPGLSSKAPPHSTLSDREIHVLRLIATGMPLKSIGEQMSLSIKTVSTYRTRILRKMDMQNNAQLVRYVTEHKSLLE